MFVHPSAEIEDGAEVGEGTRVWHLCQVRRGARIGRNCVLARGVFVDADVQVGDAVKIQNYVSVYHGVTIEDGVFVGPLVCFTNDRSPRAINPDGGLKAADDWELSRTRICRGASLGANCTIMSGTTIGEWATVGAGSVVTKDVEDHALVVGGPARRIGWICACGRRKETHEEARHCGGGCFKSREAP